MNRIFYRVLGNFVVGFCAPLIGVSVIGIAFQEAVIAALIGSLITTGLSIGYELRKIGEKKRT